MTIRPHPMSMAGPQEVLLDLKQILHSGQRWYCKDGVGHVTHGALTLAQKDFSVNFSHRLTLSTRGERNVCRSADNFF